MPKVTRTIKIGSKLYNPIDETEIEEDIAPVKELAKEYAVSNRDVKEKITGAKLVEDENGKRVLLLTGYRNEKDRSKRMVKVGGEFDPSNIVSGTRKRKNFNYKILEEKATKASSKNSFDKRSKLTEKMNKQKKSKKETEDKENVENQMADEVDDAADKKSKKKKAEWTFPLSKKNHDLIVKLGGKVTNNLPKRSYGEFEIPEAINAFVSVKWPANIRYTITKKKVGGHSFGYIKHDTFILNNEELPKWMKDNEDFIVIGESEWGMVAAKAGESSADFKVYILFDATDDEEEMVFKMPLNKYLSELKRHKVTVVEEEQKEEEEETAQESQQKEVVASEEESQEEQVATVQESQELVEQSLATDAALNEKVDIMED